MKKNKISKNWIIKQNRDIYVRESRDQGYRSRSAFKLIEIDQRFHFLSKSRSLLDLGSVPGSWSQVASKKIKNEKKSIFKIINPLKKSDLKPDLMDDDDLTLDSFVEKVLDHCKFSTLKGVRDLEGKNLNFFEKVSKFCKNTI